MYLVTGRFKFAEGGRSRAIELMAEMVRIGKGHDGVGAYDFFEDLQQDHSFFLYVEWRSKEAHDLHFNSEEMQAIVPEFFDLLCEPSDISYFDAHPIQTD